MAKETKKAAETAEKKEVTVDNVVDSIREGNLIEQEAVDAAIAEIEKDKQDKHTREAKHAILESQYTTQKELLELKKRREEDKATKACLATIGIEGDGACAQLLNKKLTPAEYKKAKKEAYKEKAKRFDEIDREYNDQIRELRNKFPNSWCYDWDNAF